MIDRLKAFFSAAEIPRESDQKLQQAQLFVLLEVAVADQVIATEEQRQIEQFIQQQGIDENRPVAEVLQELKQKHDLEASIYPYTRLINEGISREQKVELIKKCWQIAYADGQLDKYEEHRIRKIADLLYLSHKEFIQSKHDTLESL